MSFESLKDKFGNLAGSQTAQDCMKNAVQVAILAIHIGQTPIIYVVNTPNGRHAYLELDGEIFSQGVTWVTDFYPELSIRQIKVLGGVDATNQLLSQALDPETDVYGYHRVLDRLENEVPGITESVRKHLSK